MIAKETTRNHEELFELLEIFEEISKTNSANEKVNIIKDNKDRELLLPTLKFLCDERVVSGLSKKKIKKVLLFSKDFENYRFDEILNYLMANTTGTDKTIALIQGYLYTKGFTPEQLEMVENIITKRSKYGLSEESVNKVYGKGTVLQWSFMKGDSLEKHEKKVKGRFAISKKFDGNRMFVRATHVGDYEYNIVYKAKTGAILEGMSYLDDDILAVMLINGLKSMVFDGEMLAKDEEGTMTTNELYRKTQSLIKVKGDKYGMDYNIYDMVPLEEFDNGKSKLKYKERRKMMDECLNLDEYNFENIKPVDVLYYGEDKEKIEEWSLYAREQGWEGVMLNLDSGYYECKRVSTLLKVKKFYFSDVLVLDVYEGDKKNTGKLGGVTIQFKDFTTNIGGGYTDEEREAFWKNPELIIGKIITVRYFEETENKKEGKGLRFATYKGVRHDKGIEDVSYES